jgi:hypothetical protein
MGYKATFGHHLARRVQQFHHHRILVIALSSFLTEKHVSELLKYAARFLRFIGDDRFADGSPLPD